MPNRSIEAQPAKSSCANRPGRPNGLPRRCTRVFRRRGCERWRVRRRPEPRDGRRRPRDTTFRRRTRYRRASGGDRITVGHAEARVRTVGRITHRIEKGFVHAPSHEQSVGHACAVGAYELRPCLGRRSSRQRVIRARGQTGHGQRGSVRWARCLLRGRRRPARWLSRTPTRGAAAKPRPCRPARSSAHKKASRPRRAPRPTARIGRRPVFEPSGPEASTSGHGARPTRRRPTRRLGPAVSERLRFFLAEDSRKSP